MELLGKICVFGHGHCFHTQSAAALAVYCYAAALAYTLSVSIQRSRLGEHGHATHLLPVKRMRWFPTFLAFSFFTRMVWLVLNSMHAFQWVEGPRGGPYTYTHMVIDVPLLPTDIDLYVLAVTSFGKLATLLFFSAFTLLLRFWDDVLYLAWRSGKPLARIAANQSVIAEYTRDETHNTRSRKLFVVVNVWIYLVEFGLLLLKTLFPAHESVMFHFDYGFVALFFLLLALLLARCAYRLRRLMLKIEFSALATSIATRVSWLGFVVSLVFLYRSVMLIISIPTMEVFDPHGSNPWIFYAVPEILPGVLVIFMMGVKRQDDRKAGHVGEHTPLLERHRSNDLPPFQDQELHI